MKRTNLTTILTLAAASFLAGCSSPELAAPLFGLSGVCFPSDGEPTAYIVSPGLISLAEGQTGRVISATVEGATPGDLELMVAEAGITAGDATEMTTEMTLSKAEELDLTGPGTWPIVYQFTTDGQQYDLSVTNVQFEIDDVSYASSETFELTVKSDC